MFSYLWQIFFNISAVLTTIELWFINTEESQELARIRNPMTMYLRVKKEDGKDHLCEAMLDTGSTYNLISKSRVRDLQMDYEQHSDPEFFITDLDGTKSVPLGTLQINYEGGRHGHSPVGEEFTKFYVLEKVPCGMILGRPALNDLHVFVLDPLYDSKPPRDIPEERILRVSKEERHERAVFVAPRGKTIFNNISAGCPPRPVKPR